MLRNIGTLLATTFSAVAMVVYVFRRRRWASGLMKAARSRRNSRHAPVQTAAAGTMQRRASITM